VAASVVEYANPTCPDGIELVVIWKAVVAAATAMSSCIAAVCAGEEESFTRIVKDELPDWEGVPLTCPLELDRVKPDGKEPEANDHVYGAVPPAAVSDAE